ncbi:MAG: hypothetical protein F4014_03670 [Gemmatimonadetes bacterium]|nr:hypothetical protein [Gemmatimonadota bacterium]MYK97922.1 hypothetical protein [Gemmatimonadota bacterium]
MVNHPRVRAAHTRRASGTLGPLRTRFSRITFITLGSLWTFGPLRSCFSRVAFFAFFALRTLRTCHTGGTRRTCRTNLPLASEHTQRERNQHYHEVSHLYLP